MRHHLPAILAMLALPLCTASAYKTAGDGTTYTLFQLASIEASGVEVLYVGNQDNPDVIIRPTYMMTKSDTIAAGDRFVMSDGATLYFGDGVTFVIEGEADFRLKKGSTFESANDSRPIGIVVNSESSRTHFAKCDFHTVGLKNVSAQGLTIDSCKFRYNNGAIGGAALTLGADGASFTVRGCHFERNAKAAIGGSAYQNTPVVIEDCTFLHNGTANGNTPQLNLVAADSVVIRRCTIEGDPAHNMVGGIGVSSWGQEGDFLTLIEHCNVSHNRYGIATYYNQRAYIKHNTITDNCHETNPMNGGSGINVFDTYNRTQYTYIEGNRIEGSLWGITLVGGGEANLGRIDVATDDPRYNPGGNTFSNNGNGGVLYDLYNNSANTVYAQGNTWNVSQQTQEQIETVVFHQADDHTLGEVIYMPAGAEAGIGEASLLVNGEGVDGIVYDLQGRRVDASISKSQFSIFNSKFSIPKRGLYIVDGKKVLR